MSSNCILQQGLEFCKVSPELVRVCGHQAGLRDVDGGSFHGGARCVDEGQLVRHRRAGSRLPSEVDVVHVSRDYLGNKESLIRLGKHAAVYIIQAPLKWFSVEL